MKKGRKEFKRNKWQILSKKLDQLQMEEVRKAATRRRNQRIHELQEALRKMDEGNYGLCEGCGEWIAYVRLEQRPEATLCGDCAR